MKRGGNLKRTELKRKSPLKRTAMRPSGRKSKYRRRTRHVDFMMFVKRLPCAARALYAYEDACYGPVHADHAGRRGTGQKADDMTCIPLCQRHHQCRSDFSGPFKLWTQIQMREWLERQVIATSHAWSVRVHGRRA